MRRRELVRLLGLGAVGLAGCGSSDSGSDGGQPTPSGGSGTGTPTITPSSPVYPFKAGSIGEFEFEESESGTVLIRVPVENTRDEAYAGELRLIVQADGEDRTVTREIRLEGGESRKFPVEVETDWDSWQTNVQVDGFSRGTPVGEDSGGS